jgi:hypothetical protein
MGKVRPMKSSIGIDEREFLSDGTRTLKFTSVYILDGLKVLAAFTDEKALLDWSKHACPYTLLRSQAVLRLYNSGEQRGKTRRSQDTIEPAFS